MQTRLTLSLIALAFLLTTGPAFAGTVRGGRRRHASPVRS